MEFDVVDCGLARMTDWAVKNALVTIEQSDKMDAVSLWTNHTKDPRALYLIIESLGWLITSSDINFEYWKPGLGTVASRVRNDDATSEAGVTKVLLVIILNLSLNTYSFHRWH